LDYCKSCEQFESIIGATPAYLKGLSSLDKGFYRTDIEFGSSSEKSPLIIVDDGTSFHTLSLVTKQYSEGNEFCGLTNCEQTSA